MGMENLQKSLIFCSFAVVQKELHPFLANGNIELSRHKGTWGII